MLAPEGYDLENTMNGYVIGDPKMDIQAESSTLFSPAKLESLDPPVIKDTYTDSEILAVLNESLARESNWWKGNNTFANIFSFVLLAKEEYMNVHPVFEALC
jgi:hypothetical protein